MGYVERNVDPYGGHARLLRLCGNPGTVLDAGGSTGYVSRTLAERGARVIIADVDEEAVAGARAAGLEAIAVDLSREVPPLPTGTIDLPLLADVLEHLPDPVAALRRLRPLLSDKGRLVASVPNGANWALRLSLLAGRWEYTERGLLDRTHLRNFTRRSFLNTLSGGGFRVVQQDHTCPVPMIRGGALSAAAYHVAGLRPGLFAYQLIAAAIPV